MSSSATDTHLVQMPQMGISVSEGTIVEWRKAVGDEVAADETICEVTTDKIDVEIPAPAAGTLARVLAEPGDTVAVGEPIAEIAVHAPSSVPGDERNGSGSSTGGEDAGSDRFGGLTRSGVTKPPNLATGASEPDRSSFYSPVVKRIAAKHGVELDEVDGHGVAGRIRKTDLLAHIARVEEHREDEAAVAPAHAERPLHSESPYVPDPAPSNGKAKAVLAGASAVGEHREPMSSMRKAIAEHMVRSQRTAASCTTIVEVDFSAVTRRRAELRDAMAERGVSLTYLAFVAEATVRALEAMPVLNSSVDGDDIVRHSDVNLGIAVSLDEGLIVPVIHQAQRLSLEGLAAAIADLAGRARAGSLDPDDVAGGTFTITNPGQFGAVLATPIINQPQVGILDLEAIVKRPVVVEGADGEDAIAIRPTAYLPMTWDHRALDGAGAARFLGLIKGRLERGDVR